MGKPGPASSVVERSLCKNFVHKGTEVRISPRIFLFSREFIRKMIDGNLQPSDVLHRILATYRSNWQLLQSLLSEEERSLGNRSYDIIA